MEQAPFDLIPKIKVHPNYFVLYKEVNWVSGRKPPAREKFKMPETNKHNGIISNRAAGKIRKGISWLLYIANEKNLPSTYHGKTFKFKLSFITLTLSSKQIHSDHEIKTKCLNQFLVEARKKWGVVHYLWRAESQKNGNIHFHILCDKFLPWSEMRDTWNRIQNKLGYVDTYRDQMRKFHSGGFKVRETLLTKWSYKNQLRAYRTGCKHDWNAPNSSDIHSVNKIKNLPAYLAKYCTKNQEGRKIEGNLWYLSESLSKIDGLSEEIYNNLFDEINEICITLPDAVKNHSYYTIVYLSVDDWSSICKGDLYHLFQQYVKDFKSNYD